MSFGQYLFAILKTLVPVSGVRGVPGPPRLTETAGRRRSQGSQETALKKSSILKLSSERLRLER
jgi:hypothetical protein